MCGIGGILRTDGQPIPEEWLDAIDARIAYRGPDGHGRFRDRVEIADAAAPNGKRIVEVAFVHRRLSIIDHKDGHQPMVSERGRNEAEGLVAVVFNGCIYNHRELRKELEAKGHTFVTDHSDTEVLIHGWREWGHELTDHLDGMFALALWDRARAIVVLARDTFGEKPMYTASTSSRALAFGSDARALRDALGNEAGTGFPSAPVWARMYLHFGYDPQGWTFFQHDFRPPTPVKLEPGALIARGRQEKYRRQRPLDGLSALKPSSEAIEDLLDRAVASRLDADVPLGCFLSGGIDSSLVSLIAKKHKPDLMTFTVRMPDVRYDESSIAKNVAALIGTKHFTLEPSIQPADDLQFLVRTMGQPFGDSSILPSYWVSKAAREVAKVALAGDGGDELFLGYERYTAVRKLKRFRMLLRLIPQSPFDRAHPKSWWHKFGRLGQMARDFETLGVAACETIFSNSATLELLDHDEQPNVGQPFYTYQQSAEFLKRAEFDLAACIYEESSKIESPDPLAQLRSFDITRYLPNDLLAKVDTASMACGLEVRCPFLDRDLARAALAAPIEQLMPGGQRKGLLRQIARKYLPKEIVDRPKMGFAIPIGEWFRSDYGGMKTLLLDHLNSAEPFGPIQLNRKAVQRFIDEHMRGGRDHGQRLFTLLTLSIWARQVAPR